MKKIIFRADAHRKIGTGDLVSLIHLSEYFESNGWKVIFMIRDFSEAKNLLCSYGIADTVIIDKNASVSEEVSQINKISETLNIDALLLEITDRRLCEYKGIAKRIVKGCIAFDNSMLEDSDLVVNWEAEGGRSYDVQKFPKTRFLLGPEYAILPKKFDFQKINGRQLTQRHKKVLVTMGGADDLDFTRKIARIFSKHRIDLKVKFVVGAAYKHAKELKNELKGAGIDFEVLQGVKDMFTQFMNCDIAVSSGGLTLYELIATRTPTIAIATYEHQIARCNYFHKEGLISYLGFRDFDEFELINSLNFRINENKSINFKPTAIRESFNELLR